MNQLAPNPPEPPLGMVTEPVPIPEKKTSPGFDYMRDRLEDQIAWYSRKSAEAKRQFYRLQLIALLSSSAIPIVSVIPPPPWVAAVLGSMAALASGLAALFAWQNLWIRYRSTGESLTQERVLYLMRVGEYAGDNPHRILVERCEQIMSQERQTWTRAIEGVNVDEVVATAVEETKQAAELSAAWALLRTKSEEEEREDEEVDETEDQEDLVEINRPDGSVTVVPVPVGVANGEQPADDGAPLEGTASAPVATPPDDLVVLTEVPEKIEEATEPAPKPVASLPTTLAPPPKIMPADEPMRSLFIGCFDKEREPDWEQFYHRFNRNSYDANARWAGFRGELLNKYHPPRAVEGGLVAALQSMLRATGFLPYGPIDGIYGYRTMSAVRLFQEYVLTVVQDSKVGDVDGHAGKMTMTYLKGMADKRQTAHWINYDQEPSPAYRKAMDGLRKIQDKLQNSKAKDLQILKDGADRSDSLAVADWTYRTSDVHLIGIRNDPNKLRDSGERINDDKFVLLAHGMKWVFDGSTDPTRKASSRKELPFLIRGQHVYGNGWHNISKSDKRYRAWRPAQKGVLVVRSTDGRRLTTKSFDQAGEANATINIHWGGVGHSVWSAGCQTIAGRGYMNDRGQLHDLTKRAGLNASRLTNKKTRAAYNVLVDLITVFQKDFSSDSHIYYTLLNEDDVGRPDADVDFLAKV